MGSSSKYTQFVDSLTTALLSPGDITTRCELNVVLGNDSFLSKASATAVTAVLGFIGGAIFYERKLLQESGQNSQPVAYKLIDLWGRWLGLRGIATALIARPSGSRDEMAAAAMILALRALAADLMALLVTGGRAGEVAAGFDWAIKQLAAVQDSQGLKHSLANGVGALA